MIDPKLLKNDLNTVIQKLKKRHYNLDSQYYSTLENDRKTLQEKTQTLQNQRNQFSKQIGQAKKLQDETLAETLTQKVQTINLDLKAHEQDLLTLESQWNNFLLSIPNLPDDTTPEGKDENDNLEIRRWGDIPTFTFPIKDHVELGEISNNMDFAAAASITGSRFVVLKNNIARLHRKLIQFMMDTHTQQHGYEEIYVPYLVNAQALYGTGQLPKFEEDQFKLSNAAHPYYLIPTAEVPVTNLFANKITHQSMLPQQFVAHTPCFRAEAGSYGRDTRGMIRQHQFEKVELIHITHPEEGESALEMLTNHAENILQQLQLPYRVVSLCTGDIGFSAHKTYDLEVWIPSQNTYREISSCSWCGDFQARRMKARFKGTHDKKPQLLHTLNGSALAIGRTLVALLENFQNEDGSIHFPQNHPLSGF